MLKYDYVNRFLRRHFYRMGGIVAKYPYHFTFIPIATFLILVLGIIRLSVISEVEYLYVPTNSRAVKERESVEKLFPPEKDTLDILRMTRVTPSGTLILEPKDGGSVFRESIFRAAKRIDDVIKNITVNWEENVFKYEDLCFPESDGNCFTNRIFDLEKEMKQITTRRTCIGFPFHRDGLFSTQIYALWLGGVTVDGNGCIRDAKALRLMYYLSDATPVKKKVALKWEEVFVQETSQPLAGDVDVYKLVSTTLDNEASKFTILAVPMLSVALPVMFIFAVGSCMTSDWITSKPWIGVSAFFSPIVATAGAFGLCTLCGTEYQEFNVSIPFLMLAIGLDDSFVLLSAWRHTDPKNKVEQRLKETYAEAAVSISITSFTNLLSFFVGMTTPYRVHRLFFTYASLSVLFCYISEITFFGGTLALSGYREEKGLHALLFIPVKTRHKGIEVNKNNEKLCPQEEEDSPKRKELVTFYRDKLGKLLSVSRVKFAVVVAFIFLLAGGIYCLRFLKVGLEIRVVFPPSAYPFQYLEKFFERFSAYPHVIQVVIDKTLDYSDPVVQKDVEEILSNFTNADHMSSRDIGASWLHSYLASINDAMLSYSYGKFNVSHPEDFTAALNTVFLQLFPFRHFSKDVLFNENRTQILASRFMLVSRNVMNGYEEADLISELWKIADNCKYPVHVHNVHFVVQSLSSEVVDSSVRTILTSTFLAMAVFIVTIPNLLCIILVGIVVGATEICVVGYMSLWEVGLDIVSSTALIVTTGLAVDYLAHVSYAYIVCRKEDPNDKMREALHSAGHPVLQGCFSTVLLVCSFPFADAFAFIIFFKLFLLLMLFAGFSALTLLPVSLTLCEYTLKLINSDKRTRKRAARPLPESLRRTNYMRSKGEQIKSDESEKGNIGSQKERTHILELKE